MVLIPLLKGFTLGAGLIIAIGAQNTFVLKQGLKREHLLLTALTCSLCDSILIVLGVTGLGAILNQNATLSFVLRWAGALFLIGYGIRSLLNIRKAQPLNSSVSKPETTSAVKTFVLLLALGFLNPHAYVDTFLLLGTVGAQYPIEEHLPFIVGAILASLVWFFCLTYGASKLAPLFKNRLTWQILDGVIGCLMLALGLSLVF